MSSLMTTHQSLVVKRLFFSRAHNSGLFHEVGGNIHGNLFQVCQKIHGRVEKLEKTPEEKCKTDIWIRWMQIPQEKKKSG